MPKLFSLKKIQVILISGLLILTLPSCLQETSVAPVSTQPQEPETGNTEPPVTEEPTTPQEAAEERAKELVSSWSVQENVQNIVMAYFPGTDISALTTFITDTKISGSILMGSNIPYDENSLAEMTTVLTGTDLPRLIAIDEEGGIVTRLPWDFEPGATTLKYLEPAATFDAFSNRAMLLEAAGITINFGIVADIPTSEYDFIYDRSLGVNPEDAQARVTQAVLGEGDRVFSTLKHFPGHGAAQGDSHFNVPIGYKSYDEWLTSDALPFKAGIEAGAELVMLGHLLFPEIDSEPATLSKRWHEILRNDLGFAGVTVTDDLAMLTQSGNAEYNDITELSVRAINAGNDLLLYVALQSPEQVSDIIETLTTAVQDGVISKERLIEASTRVAYLRALSE